MKTVKVALACNNEHGLFLGRLAGVRFGEDMISLSQGRFDYDMRISYLDIRGQKPRVKISRHTYPVFGYSEFVGNLCWDEVTLKAEDAAQLLNRLFLSRHWICEEAREELFRRWETGIGFSHLDLLEAAKE